MATGSNELNMLLKAKVVKIRVELDVKGSGLHGQVNGITKFLKEKPVKLKIQLDEKSNLASQVNNLSTLLKDKPLKLKVQISSTVAELTKQINTLSTQLKTDGSPIKLSVQIDVKGSANIIKKQLKDVHDTVADFNKKYAKQLEQMQKANYNPNQIKKPTLTAPAIDNSLYVNSLKEAQRNMKNTFGKGLFTSHEMKDANGELLGFMANLTKANGVIQKIKYQWDAGKKTFTPVSQQTLTETEKSIHKASQALKMMYSDIEKLKKGGGKSSLLQEFDNLEKRVSHGTLNMDAVKNLQRMVKEEGLLQQQVKNSNSELLSQKKLIHDITKARDADWKKTQDVNKRNQFNSLLRDVKTNPQNLKEQAFDLKRLNDLSAQGNKLENDRLATTKQRMKVSQELRGLESKTVSSDRTSQQLISEIKLMTQRAKTGKDWLAIQSKMNQLKNSNSNDAQVQKSIDLQFKIEQKLRRLKDLGQLTETQFANSMAKASNSASRTVADLQRQFNVLDRRVKKSAEENLRIANQTKVLHAKGSTDAGKIKSLVNQGDINALQNYFGAMYKGKVQSMAMVETTDRLGRAVTEMKIKMAGSGKQVQTYTLQMERANGALRQTANGMDYNANRNLGVMEQLKIAMARVPVWMVAMTAFYSTIRGVKQMTTEVLKLDKSLTELRRVASSSLSIDNIFEGAVKLSKELGNNIHDVMQAVNDLSRTFGHMNERQLLAITRTAVLMSNVSDLTAQEATESLVGTMNAFNISASESIRIVDALNEVDNDYAISTKQLATGLQKSASTSRTFGVTLEENVGHITAIGAVTMESGNIIGNSLKTIYSRITTMDGAIEALQGVGVEMTNLSGGTREVGDIIHDLGQRWTSLTDDQRQNIAVTVAGRYQLSRFLALMNNYEMATNATTTALHSEGSAMRENAEYLKSFEARINSLKNSFTEFASAVGKAVLSDGLMGAIGLLGKLADAGIWVANTFGVLPIVFGLVAGALLKFGIFTSLIASVVKFGAIYKAVMIGYEIQTRRAVATGVSSATAIRLAWNGVTASQTAVGASARAMGAAWKSALIGTGIGVAFVVAGVAIEKFISASAEAKRKTEELEKTNKKMVDGYRKHRDGMDGLVNRYDELTNKQNKNKDEQIELARITKELAENLPTTAKYIDANGKAHMKSTVEIKREIEAVKELSKVQAEMENAKFEEKLEKQSKSYNKITDNIKKLREEAIKLRDAHGKDETIDVGFGMDSQSVTSKADNTKALQKNKIETLMAEAEKTEAIKKTVKTLQSQTLAYFEANGMMDALGDEQQKVVENFIQFNEGILRNAKNYDDAFVGLFEMGKQVGQVFVDAYDIMSRDVDPSDSIGLSDIKTQLDSIAKTVPQTFYSLTDEQGRVVKSSADVTNGLKEIVNVSHEVGSAGAESTNDFIYRLQRAGLTAEDAQGYLWKFANESNNVKIKAELASQGVNSMTGDIADLNKEVIEAIDLTSTLFGFSSGEIDGMKSRLQAMHLMVDQRGVLAKKDEDYLLLQQEVAEYLGITADEVAKNSSALYTSMDEIGGIDWTLYRPEMNMNEFVDSLDITDATKKLLKDYDGMTNIFTGEVSKVRNEVEKEVKELKTNTEAIFADLSFDIPAKDYTNTFMSLAYVEQYEDDLSKTIDNMNAKIGTFGLELGTPTGSALFDSLLSQISVTDGKIDESQTNIQAFKYLINTAVENPALLASLGLSLDGVKEKTEGAGGALDTVVQKTNTASIGSPFAPLNTDADTLTDKLKGVGTEIESLNNPYVLNTNPLGTFDSWLGGTKGLAQETVVEASKVVSAGSQISTVSGDIKIVMDETSNLKNHLGEINTSLGGLGEGFTTGAVVAEIGKISDKAKSVKVSVDKLKAEIGKIGSIEIVGLSELISQIGMLSGNLNLATQYGNSTALAQQSVVDAFNRVASATNAYNTALSSAGANAGSSFSNMSAAIMNAVAVMLRIYQMNSKGLSDMVTVNNQSLLTMGVNFDKASERMTIKVKSMTSEMHKAFKSGIKGIVTSAGDLPNQIGKAIRDNMSSSTSAMDALAKDMVKRFKSELGIHSPSRVFTQLGGHVIQGLTNGLSGGNLVNLGKQVFGDFGGEAFSSIDSIKDYLQFGAGDMGLGANFSEFVATSGFGMRTHPITGDRKLHAGQDFAGAPNSPIQAKAGGKVTASGASGNGFGNYVKVKNGEFEYIYAHLNKALAKVGSTIKQGQLLGLMGSTGASTGTHLHYEVRKNGKAINPRGYKVGGLIKKEQIIRVGEEDKEEMIIPLEQHRGRAVDLWKQAGERLGQFKYFATGGTVGKASSKSTYITKSGDHLTGIAQQFGTTVKALLALNSSLTYTNKLTKGTEVILKAEAKAKAKDKAKETAKSKSKTSSKTTSKTSSKKDEKVDPRENIADAFKYNPREREINKYAGVVSLVEAKMAKMNKHSEAYRKSMQIVIKAEAQRSKYTKLELEAVKKRQTVINNQIKALPALGKQTTKQRETYNTLMQEFDSNLTKINTLKVELENTIIGIDEKYMEKFKSSIDEIVAEYTNAIEAIKYRIDNIDFELDVLELTDPENVTKKLELIVDRTRELMREQSRLEGAKTSITGQLATATKRYGADSDIVKEMIAELNTLEESWEDTTLAILTSEKEIRDIRKGIADEIIDAIKKNYEEMEALAIKASKAEIDSLKKAHDEKMKIYDKEIDKINKIYDERIKAMDDADEEDTYQEELDGKNTDKSKLVNKISLLSQDNTLEGRKKLSETQEELRVLQDEIDKFMKARHKELLKEQLGEEKDALIDGLNNQKETDQQAHDSKVEALEAEQEKISEHYKAISEDEKRWAELRKQLMQGNFKAVEAELTSMGIKLETLSDGTFNTLSEGFANYSQEVRDFVSEINTMIDNINDMTNFDSSGKVTTSRPTTISEVGNIISGVYSGKQMSSPTPDKQYLYDMIKNSSVSEKHMNEIWKKAQSGDSLDVPTPEKMKFYNMFLEIMRSNGMKRFDTGGYTGDWAGNGGRIAVLDKKELVLEQNDTKNLLDMVSLMNGAKSNIPKFARNTLATDVASSGVIMNSSYGDINITIEGGDKKKATAITKEITTEMRKKGRMR